MSLQPPTGWRYVNVGTPNTTATSRLTNSDCISVGIRSSGGSVIGTGSVVIYNDATFSADPGCCRSTTESMRTAKGGGLLPPRIFRSITASVQSGSLSDAVSSTKVAQGTEIKTSLRLSCIGFQADHGGSGRISSAAEFSYGRRRAR